MNTSVNTVDELIQKWQALSPKLQRQVIDFVEFLLSKYRSPQSEESKNLEANESDRATSSFRTLGIHKGMGLASDDFNDVLPDEFWLGSK